LTIKSFWATFLAAILKQHSRSIDVLLVPVALNDLPRPETKG
jgi:hypothetical protein